MTNKEPEASQDTSQPKGPYILKETDLFEIQPIIDVGQGFRGITLHLRGMAEPVGIPLDLASGLVLAINTALVEADVFSDLYTELMEIAAAGTPLKGTDETVYRQAIRNKADHLLGRFVQSRNESYARRNNEGVVA